MNRTMIGTAIGMGVGLFLLAAAGAKFGYEEGIVTSKTPPGIQAALWWAFAYLAYFWWLAAAIGGAIGGLAAFGSWLVRRR
jgi:hypothetical protein